MKALKLTFILLDFILALAFAFIPENTQNTNEMVDDYSECYEQIIESNLTL
ncbi:MAG: hypothetical protein HOD63_07410 [Bacteroidetes bacterium]|nr:hypothetical protein [Bacteroidota bacterium]MBT5529777.1 hypothetical protein [Cytophagia bacterium]MBT3422949.1 hypothetical protein [Bacteroidota bacterium]MBT4338400.1 hypothetical protein [Bacteroidota bacterium]MBT4729306.1 hypothetical protein [Bacteroidota bacterium]